MKITTPGTAPEPTLSWWVGRKARCENCGCEIEIEEMDQINEQITTHAERRPGGRQWVEIRCPMSNCRTLFTLEKT